MRKREGSSYLEYLSSPRPRIEDPIKGILLNTTYLVASMIVLLVLIAL